MGYYAKYARFLKCPDRLGGGKLARAIQKYGGWLLGYHGNPPSPLTPEIFEDALGYTDVPEGIGYDLFGITVYVAR